MCKVGLLIGLKNEVGLLIGLKSEVGLLIGLKSEVGLFIGLKNDRKKDFLQLINLCLKNQKLKLGFPQNG